MTAMRTTAEPVNARSASVIQLNLAGIGTLIRFILRRDRIRLPVWIVTLVLFTVLTASSLPDFYLTAADRQARAELMSNPAARAMAGPGYGLENYTFGAMLANEMLGIVAIFTAIMSILLVVRHTRVEEETGRAELVRSAIVGRHSHLSAAFIVLLAANVSLGIVMALSLAIMGIEDIDWTGSLAFGLALTSVGVVFGTIAGVGVQVFEHSKSASAMAFAVLGGSYAMRAAGDMSNGWLSWSSPIGWAQASRAYVDERWWPIAVSCIVALLLAVVAYKLSTQRDVGAGLRAPARGSARASQALMYPVGFAARLHKGSLIAWGLGLFVFCAIYGTLSSEVDQFIVENPALEDWLAEVEGASLIENWLGYIVGFMAMVGGAFAILAALRIRGEEASNRVEPLLSTAISRDKWLWSHLVIALGGSIVMLVVIGVGLGSSAAFALDDWSLLPTIVSASLAYAPALWLLVGLVVALFGFYPRGASLAWLALVYSFTVGMLGAFLQFPEWMNDLSPFAFTPAMPAEEMSFLRVGILTVVAGVFVGLGISGFRRRDLDLT